MFLAGVNIAEITEVKKDNTYLNLPYTLTTHKDTFQYFLVA